MDTQGTFDEHSPLEHGAIVVAFTLLHSCTVLYNLQQNLDERQLQSLQAFAECARLANTSGKSNESPDASSGDDERCSPEETLPSRTFELPKPFQRLLLLIRDWSSPADCPYGACGGIQLLRRRSLIDRPTLPDTLQCSSRLLRRKSAAMKANHKHIWDKRVKSAESISRVGQSNDQRVNKTQISTAIRVNALKSNQTEGAQTSDNQTAAVRPKKVAEQNRAVRRYLLDSFESLDAFLMPHPGTQVSASRTHDGRWSEWSKEFREQAQALILHVHTSLNVLHPLGGGLSSNQATAYSALNGSQLLRRCIRITEKLLKHGSQALPLYEALGELSHSESVEMVCNDFENQMRELFGPDRPWMAPLEWRLLYSQLEANAFKQYDHSRRFNAATLGELYRQQLARRLKQISSRFGTLNRYKRRTNSWRYAFILLTALFCVRFAAEVLKAMGLEGTGNKVKLLNIGVVALLSLHFMRYIWDLPLLDYIDQAGHYVFAAAARI